MLKFIILISFSFSLVAAPRIEVKSSVGVHKGIVRLGTIASITGFSEENQKELENVIIANNLQNGELRKIGNSTITDKLRMKLPLIREKEADAGNSFKLTLKVPEEVSLYVIDSDFSNEKIQKRILLKQKEKCEECSFEIQNFNIPKFTNKDIRRWELSLDRLNLKGSFQLPLKIWNASEQEEKIYWVSGYIKALKKMPVLVRNLKAGDLVQHQDISWEKREITYPNNTELKKELIGKANLKRSMFAGSIIWMSSIERIKALKRGDVVDVVISNEDWKIKLKGIAQKSGFVGDTVTVLNRSSQKEVIGKIIANGVVEVQ